MTSPREGTQIEQENNVLTLSALRFNVEDRLKTNNQKRVVMHLSGMISRPESVDLRYDSTNETLLDGTKRPLMND
jgi:hypothetical protein